MDFLLILLGALLVCAGYALCYFTVKRHGERAIEVPRVKPSLRSPLKTYAVQYERFKARDTNLYQPSVPKRESG